MIYHQRFKRVRRCRKIKECDETRVTPVCKAKVVMMNGFCSSLRLWPYTLGIRVIASRLDAALCLRSSEHISVRKTGIHIKIKHNKGWKQAILLVSSSI